jgi:hypothetical protein
MIFYDSPFWCKMMQGFVVSTKKCGWTQAKKQTQVCYLLWEIKLCNIPSQNSVFGCAVICKAWATMAKSLKSAMPTRCCSRMFAYIMFTRPVYDTILNSLPGHSLQCKAKTAVFIYTQVPLNCARHMLLVHGPYVARSLRCLSDPLWHCETGKCCTSSTEQGGGGSFKDRTR